MNRRVNGKTLDPSGIIKEAQRKARVYGKDFGLGIHKRRGCGQSMPTP
jgi:hypothetical protein